MTRNRPTRSAPCQLFTSTIRTMDSGAGRQAVAAYATSSVMKSRIRSFSSATEIGPTESSIARKMQRQRWTRGNARNRKLGIITSRFSLSRGQWRLESIRVELCLVVALVSLPFGLSAKLHVNFVIWLCYRVWCWLSVCVGIICCFCVLRLWFLLFCSCCCCCLVSCSLVCCFLLWSFLLCYFGIWFWGFAVAPVDFS